ncbi:MAG: cytochrome P450 [Chloroflexota bacterium]|nr:cytochrome P450 [Chloroflexota bacterium]
MPLLPPPGPGRYIPYGDLQAIRRSPLGALAQIAQRYGDVLQYPVGFWTIYVVSDPAGVRQVLQENSRNYSKATFQYGLLGLVAGQGLLSSDGAVWLRQRRLIQPAFHRDRLTRLATQTTDATAAMLDRWDGVATRGDALDIDGEMMRLTLEIVGKTLFSADFANDTDALSRAALTTLDHIAHRARSPLAFPPKVPTPRNRAFMAAIRMLDGAIFALIARRRRDPEAADDLLAMLMCARDADTGEGMSDRQLRDEIITFLIAGHETVASALIWTWYSLALHPAIERKLHEELTIMLGHRPPMMDDLPRLPYTRMVVDETLRLYPPSWISTRRAIARDTIGGYHIPANALIVMSPYVTHRRANEWPNPEGFDPERFMPEAHAARPRFAYFPFGGGPHLCIGQSFALVETQLIVATVAERYRLALVPGQHIEVAPLVTLRPKHGMFMHPIRRATN